MNLYLALFLIVISFLLGFIASTIVCIKEQVDWTEEDLFLRDNFKKNL